MSENQCNHLHLIRQAPHAGDSKVRYTCEAQRLTADQVHNVLKLHWPKVVWEESARVADQLNALSTQSCGEIFEVRPYRVEVEP